MNADMRFADAVVHFSKVRNTIKHLTDDPEDAAVILAAADIAPTSRPTTLSGEQIEAVAKQMELRWQANDSWPDKSK